jgi:hypothetical protein
MNNQPKDNNRKPNSEKALCTQKGFFVENPVRKNKDKISRSEDILLTLIAKVIVEIILNEDV